MFVFENINCLKPYGDNEDSSARILGKRTYAYRETIGLRLFKNIRRIRHRTPWVLCKSTAAAAYSNSRIQRRYGGVWNTRLNIALSFLRPDECDKKKYCHTLIRFDNSRVFFWQCVFLRNPLRPRVYVRLLVRSLLWPLPSRVWTDAKKTKRDTL